MRILGNLNVGRVRSPACLVALFLLVLSACGGASTTGSSKTTYSSPVTNLNCHGCGNGVTLHVWASKATGSTAAGQAELWSHWTNEFKSLTGATIDWTPWYSATDEVTKLNGAITSHSGPDVFEMGDTFVSSAATGGALYHLTKSDWNLLGGRQRFFPTQMKLSGPAQDNWSSVPEFMNPYGMTYNTKLFQEGGITTPPATWSQFVSDAEKISQLGNGTYGTALFPADNFQSWKLMYIMTEQMGGSFVTANGKKPSLNTPDLAAAERFWFNWLVQYHIVPQASLTWNTATQISNFAKGNLGMMVITDANVEATLKDSPVANDYKFAPMPQGPVPGAPKGSKVKPVGTIAVGDNWSALSSSKHRDLALRFLNMVTDNQSQLLQQKLTGNLPVNVKTATSLAKQDSRVAVFVNSEKTATPTPFISYWGSIEAELASVQTNLASSVSQGQAWSGKVPSLLTQANSAVSTGS